jgi:hypothetical protein
MAAGRKLTARGRLLTVGGLFVVLFAFGGPAALAAQTVSQQFSFTTTSANGTRLLTSTPPTIAATDLGSSGGVVASSVDASSTVVEAFATGANWTVTAQICGPTGASTITATQAALASADCSGFGNQISGYDTTSGAYLTNIAGSRVTATQTLANAGSSISPLLHGTATTTSSSAMSAPVTVLDSGSTEVASSSYNGTYQATSALNITNVDKNATWYGFWVTTLQP